VKRLPSFISVFKQKRRSTDAFADKRVAAVPTIDDQIDDVVGSERRAKIRLPSFISHPNGILLRVFKRQRSMIETISGPKFICRPDGMVLKVLNQRARKSPFRTAVSARCGTVLCLHRSTSILSPSAAAAAAAAVAASMVKMDMETQTNRNAEQRVKKLNRVKQRANQQHYSHAHHWPPQQQYKSKSWTIAIILKLTFVAWDSWTYRIGY